MSCGPEEHRLDCSITEASLVFEERCQGLKGPKSSEEGEEVQTVCGDHQGKPSQKRREEVPQEMGLGGVFNESDLSRLVE